MLTVNHYYQNLNHNHSCDICGANADQFEGVLATCTVDGLVMTLCDNCIAVHEQPADDILEACDYCNEWQATAKVRDDFQNERVMCDDCYTKMMQSLNEDMDADELFADDYAQYVVDMEASVNAAWHTVEVYRFARFHFGKGVYDLVLTAVDGLISTIQLPDNPRVTASDIGLSHWLCEPTWGMNLRGASFRKVETYYANSFTGEKTYTDPAKA